MGLRGTAGALLARGVVGLQRHHQREVEAGVICRAARWFGPAERTLDRADQLRAGQPGQDRTVIAQTSMAPGAVGLGQQGGAGVPQPQFGAAEQAVEHTPGFLHHGLFASRIPERPAQRTEFVAGNGIDRPEVHRRVATVVCQAKRQFGQAFGFNGKLPLEAGGQVATDQLGGVCLLVGEVLIVIEAAK